MTLFTLQSAPFKTLTILFFVLLFSCKPAEDDGFTPPDPPVDPEWNVTACVDLSQTTAVVGEILSLSSCNDPVDSYSWKINGSEISTSSTASWTFETPGSYQVELTIGNADGQTATSSEVLNVEAATSQFKALTIPAGAVRRSVGMQVNDQNDIFLITENKDQDDLVLMNFDANLNLNWQKPLATLNWEASITSMAKIDQGWLINSTEALGDNAYLSKWVITDQQGNATSQDLNSVFYRKVIALDNNEFVAIGYRLTILDDGTQGTQAILDHYAGDLSLIKSLKLQGKTSSSFTGDFYVAANNAYHAVSYVEQTNGQYQAQYAFLSTLANVPNSIPWSIQVDNIAQVKNMNTEILVAGAEEIFLSANNKLFIVSNGNNVQTLPYNNVEKIHSWQDKVFVMTDNEIMLVNNAGNQLWKRQLVNGSSIGAVLANGQLFFDRTVPLDNGAAEQEYQIYIGAINSEGVFGNF